MDLWENKIIKSDEQPTEQFLNNKGETGWELVCVVYRHDVYTIYFKRKIVQPPA